jgi:two-component system response regulator NreC
MRALSGGAPSDPIHVLLAEDHPIVRCGLRALLEAMPGVVVVGESGDGSEVVDLVLQLDPDVVLLDITLPHQTGLEIVATLTQKRVRARVLILSMHDEEEYVLKALRNGASGYMLKSADLEELKLAIRSVLEGHRYLSTPLSNRAIDAYVIGAQEPAKAEAPRSEAVHESPKEDPDGLTSRQREVLQLMAEGYGNSQIGHRLGISPRTAELHRAHVMRKLKLHSQTDVVLYAIQRGLISVEK